MNFIKTQRLLGYTAYNTELKKQDVKLKNIKKKCLLVIFIYLFHIINAHFLF